MATKKFNNEQLRQIQPIQKQLNNATGMAALRLAARLTRLEREASEVKTKLFVPEEASDET